MVDDSLLLINKLQDIFREQGLTLRSYERRPFNSNGIAQVNIKSIEKADLEGKYFELPEKYLEIVCRNVRKLLFDNNYAVIDFHIPYSDDPDRAKLILYIKKKYGKSSQ